MEYVTLNNGVKMPILGYGVYQVIKEECKRCVLDALKVGYRAIDTAQSYFNEEEVGEAIAESGIPREEIFLLLIENMCLYLIDHRFNPVKGCKINHSVYIKIGNTDCSDLTCFVQFFQCTISTVCI